MAMTYQNFASLGVNLNRQKYGPLDISNVFTSAADLKYYLTKGTFTEGVSEYWYKSADEKIVPYPYEGQVLATVIDGVVSVYALSLDAEGNFQTQEIGAKVEVDGTTIVKDASGKLSIVAPANPDEKKTYNFSYANGVYSWVEVDTATAAGQAQAIQGLTDRTVALEETVNGKGEGEAHVAGLVEKVAALEAVDNATQAELDAYKEVVTKAIGDALQAAKDYADENDANTEYNDAELRGRIETIESDYLKEEDKYDDTELTGRVTTAEGKITTLEGVVGNAESGLVKAIADEIARAQGAESDLSDRIDAIDFIDPTELADAIKNFATTQYVDTEIEAIEDAISKLNHFTAKVVTDKAEMTDIGVLYLFKVDSAAGSDVYEEYVVVDGVATLIGDTTTDLSNYYDKDAIDGKVEALEGAIADEAEARGELAEKVAALEAVDNATQEELDAYKLVVAQDIADAKQAAIDNADGKLADKLDTATFTEFQSTNASAIATAKQEAIDAAAAAEEAKGYAVASDVADTYATKAMLETHESEIENELLAYAKTADVNAELAKKIETGSIAHSSESLAEGVTVDGTKLNIVVDAYTKQEVRDYVADVIEDMTGGESAADVLLALNNHIATYEEKVGQIDAKDAAQDTAIAKAQEDATKGINDAAKVAADLVTANAAIADNTREIGVAKGSIESVNTTLTEKITALENADTKFTGDITALQGIVSGEGGHASRITALEGRATNLETRDTELAALIKGNTDKFADYSTTAQMNSAIEAAIAGADLSTYAKVTDVEAIYKAGVDGGAATGVLAEEIARATAAEKVNSDAIAAIIGTDTGKTIRAIAAEETAAIVAGADAKYDTLKEIADFIMNDETGAAAMANDIAALKTTVGNAESGLVKAVADNAAAIAEIVQPTGSAEVTVAADGTLGLGQVSTDKLVMGSNTLVIDGGSAAE